MLTKDQLHNRHQTINMILEDLMEECLQNPGSGLDEIYIEFVATNWTFFQWINDQRRNHD